MLEGQKINRGNLNGAEFQAIFRTGLKEELRIAVRNLAAPRKFQGPDLNFGEIFIAAFTAILHVQADADHVPPEVMDAVSKGWSQTDRATLETMLAFFVPPDDIKEIRIIAALQQVGAPVCENTIHEARTSLLRGMMQTRPKNSGQALTPLLETGGDELEALLHGKLAQEVLTNAPCVAAPKRKTVSDVEQAILHRASQPPPPRPVQAEVAPTAPITADTAPLEETETDPVDEPSEVSFERIVEDLAWQEGATFRSPGTLFREFLTACRQQGVVSANIDMGEFRRLFAFALPAPSGCRRPRAPRSHDWPRALRRMCSHPTSRSRWPRYTGATGLRRTSWREFTAAPRRAVSSGCPSIWNAAI